jgi:hypothetical protein
MHEGIDLRASSGIGADRLMFEEHLIDVTGADITSGTASMRLYEEQSDGTLKSYDFADNTFKSTALTTETQALTHRTGNNGTYNTGIWSYALTTLTGFTPGKLYICKVSHSSLPSSISRKFQYGGLLALNPATKYTFDIATGVLKFYDGATLLRTLTPTEAAGLVTQTGT